MGMVGFLCCTPAAMAMTGQASASMLKRTKRANATRKVHSPKAEALVAKLADGRLSPTERAAAATQLATMRAVWAAPALRKAARSTHPLLRKRSRRALRRLCPRYVKRRRFYLDLDQLKVYGRYSSSLRRRLLRRLHRYYANHRRVTTVWARCRKPSRRALRRRRMKGYALNAKINLDDLGRKTRARINMYLMTYPGKSLKASNRVKFEAGAAITQRIVNLLFPHIYRSLRNDINQFLSSR